MYDEYPDENLYRHRQSGGDKNYCHIATIPFKVLKQMYGHALTEKGIILFQEDWKKL